MKFKDFYEAISNLFDKLENMYPNVTPYLYAILSSLFMAIGSLLVKQCKEFPAYEFIFFRSIFLLLATSKMI